MESIARIVRAAPAEEVGMDWQPGDLDTDWEPGDPLAEDSSNFGRELFEYVDDHQDSAYWPCPCGVVDDHGGDGWGKYCGGAYWHQPGDPISVDRCRYCESGHTGPHCDDYNEEGEWVPWTPSPAS